MTKLIFIGGFLGAGKTSLLYEVSGKLVLREKKIALITNDQAPDLFDTALLSHTSLNVQEVAGSCFCCDFKGLKRSIDNASIAGKKDYILAEPVGSCTDLTATLINPIRKMMNGELSIAPLTVLADPGRMKQILAEITSIHPSAAYIMRKQIEECEILALTKSDLHSEEDLSELSSQMKELFPECKIMIISTKTGDGIDDWLNYVIENESSSIHVPEIDYDRYAEGEAVLGWLNCSANLSGDGIDFDSFTRLFMEEFSRKLDLKDMHVGHVKMMVERSDKYIASNLTGKSDTLSFRWSAGTGDYAEMIFNARVEMSPGDLEKMFLGTLRAQTKGKIDVDIKRLSSISPGYPKPTYRFTDI